jgi:hypothetical protein
MPSRKHISLKTKLASALLMLKDIPYEESKGMSAEQIISLYQFDHGILHATEPIDEPWNLTPRLIHEHRQKSKKDTAIVAKSRRIEKKWSEFTAKLHSKPAPKSKKYRWPKRKFGC